MLAVAWVDGAEGRRWVIRRGVMLMVFGVIVATIGRLIEPRVMWGGVDIVLLGVVVIVWAIFHANRGRTVRVPEASKPCVMPSCDGTMHFQAAMSVANAPHTLEWPWRASWRCAKDSEHVQLLTPREAREIISSMRAFGRRS